MREISACGSTWRGAGIARSRPSTRMRTTRPVRNGSMWMSVARSSTAFSSRSLTARTTGAPLARSRRLSTSSSARAVAASSASRRRTRRPRRAARRARSRCPRTRRPRSRPARRARFRRRGWRRRRSDRRPPAGDVRRRADRERSRSRAGSGARTSPSSGVAAISCGRATRGKPKKRATSSAKSLAESSLASHSSCSGLSPSAGVNSSFVSKSAALKCRLLKMIHEIRLQYLQSWTLSLAKWSMFSTFASEFPLREVRNIYHGERAVSISRARICGMLQ